MSQEWGANPFVRGGTNLLFGQIFLKTMKIKKIGLGESQFIHVDPSLISQQHVNRSGPFHVETCHRVANPGFHCLAKMSPDVKVASKTIKN